VIRSYLSTLHKQGDNLFHVLTMTFQRGPPASTQPISISAFRTVLPE
jgi:hypothetical protein